MLEVFFPVMLLTAGVYIPLVLFLTKLLELFLHKVTSKIISFTDSSFQLKKLKVGYSASFLNKVVISAIILIPTSLMVADIIGPMFGLQTITLQTRPLWSRKMFYKTWYLRGNKIYLLDKDCVENCVFRKMQIPLPTNIHPKKLLRIKTYHRHHADHDYVNAPYILLLTKNNEYYLLGAKLYKDYSTPKITIHRLLAPIPEELTPIKLYIINNNTFVGKLNPKTNSRYLYYFDVSYSKIRKNTNIPYINVADMRYQLIRLAPANFSIMKKHNLSFPYIYTSTVAQTNEIEYPFYNNCILTPNTPKILYTDNTITIKWHDPYLPKENNKRNSNTDNYYNAYLKFYWGPAVKQNMPPISTIKNQPYLVWSRGGLPILGMKLSSLTNTYLYTELEHSKNTSSQFINTTNPVVNGNPRWFAICHDSSIETCNAVVGSLPLNNNYYYLPVECNIILKYLK